MKNFNLIEWLSRNSHEKQSPQRFARYAAMLIMLLTLGVGEMEAATSTTVYYAVNTSYTVKCNVNRKGDGSDWATYTMSKNGKKYNGVDIYSCTFTDLYDGLGCMQLQLYDGSTWKSQVEPISSWTSASTYNGKLYNGSSWVAYTYDFINLAADFTATTWSTTSYPLTLSDGTYSITVANVAASSHKFKITKWYNSWTDAIGYSNKVSGQNLSSDPSDESGSSGNNIVFTPSHAGSVKITYNSSTGNIAILAPYQVSYAAGTGATGTVSASAVTTYGSTCTLSSSTFSKTGYTQDGWATSDGGEKAYNLGATYTGGYTDVTLYPHWVENMSSVTLTASPSGKGTFQVGDATVTSTTAGVTTTRSVTAVPISGYHFVSWSITGGASISSTTANPTTVTGDGTGDAATLTATFAADDVYSLTVAAGTGISSVSGSTNDIKAGNNIAISATVATGYTWSTWTKTAGSGTLSTFTAGTKNQTVTVGTAGDITLTASATQNMSSLTTSCHYDAGNPSYAIPTKSASSIGIATTSTLTATAASTGYTFAGWTLSSNLVVTSGNASTDRTITVRTNGNGAAATAQANYNEVLTQDTWVIKGGTAFGGTAWTTEHALAKQSGHSTESVVYKTFTISSTNTGDSNDNFKFKVVKKGSPDAYFGLTADGSYYLNRSESGMEKTLATENADIQLRADVAGDYIFKVDYSTPASPKLTITFPTSYTLTYDIGTVKGTSGSISTSPTTASGSKVLSGNSVTLTGPAAKSGYTWKGWYTNAAGTSGNIPDVSRAITVTMNADKTLYACYTEDMHTVTVTTDGHGSITTPASGSPRTVSAGIATSASIAASASTGYTFYNWTKTSGSGTVTFTNANAASTTVKATSDATVRANFVDMWNVKGSWDSWAAYEPMTATGVSNTYSATKTLAAKTEYHIKVVKRIDSNSSNDKWYGVNGGKTLTRASGSVTGLEENGGETEYITFTTDAAGNYTITYLYNASVGSMKVTVGYPAAYTVTFGMGTGGSTITASTPSAGGSFTSGDYVASGADVTFTQTASSTGYTFTGWYTTKDTGGSAVTGMGVSDNVLENVTSNKTVWSRYTANTYTVSFDKNEGTVTPSPSSKSVTFGSAYGTLPSGMKHASKTFVGWFTESSGGTQVTAETIVSTARDHTLYAQYENVYAVNVDFKSGDAKVYPSTVVNASPTSLTPTIIAPEIFGYSFTGWTGTNVSPADASSATTTITATAATTITANYAVVPTVYFKNNLGWDSVFVSFDCGWATVGEKSVPSNKTKPYYKMTQIGTTDIYYCEIPSTYTANNYASWSRNIAFDNTNYGGHAGSDHIGTWDFYGGEFTGRGDFDPKATLFIPYNGDTEARNGGTFYQTGCWMKYNSTESGYEVKMYKAVSGGTGDTLHVNLTAANAGGYEFSAKLNLKHPNYGYGFKLHKFNEKNTTDLWYTNTGKIEASTETLPWHFWAGTSITETSQRCELYTEALGDYTITVSFATGRPEVNVEYPTQVGDWRLAYNDIAAWSGDKHEASWYIYSRVIKAKANAVDTVSFYVNTADSASAHIELQKCTAINPSTGAETWEKQGSNLDLSGLPGTGIYNFKVTQDGSKDVTSAVSIGGYEGNFYIRTDASDGGWNNYISSGKNVMTYSEYAKDNSGFTHYFMRFVNTGTNIKFCIANDYSPCLTEYCIGDDYTGEYISVYGNVRFMWDHRTNAVTRAYISGSSFVADRFLVLEGDAKLFDENGNALTEAGGGKIADLNDNEMKFIDDQNWIYETTVEAIPGSKFKLTAKYNNKIQYFYGDEGSDPADSVLLLGGSGEDKYEMRIVYDFKTNRLIKAFVPEGAINTNLAIETDLMIIRDHQDDAKQVTFGVGGRLSDVKTVYGAMKFNKYTLNGKERTGGHASTSDSRYKRDLFYISFPFDVKLNEAFGFGTYGKHWIIEYYDGKTRAAKGFWADSDPNWKFVTPSQRNNGYTMKAFEGYILALDLDELTESSDVWNNGVENVYIYFPSSALVENIAATNRLVTIDQTGYECTINRNTLDGDRRVKDSYWHCIGVPSFANYSGTLYDVNEGTAIDWRDNDGGDLWKTPNLPYLYTINWADKSLSVSSTANFNFQATWSYLVQYQKSSIYWSNVNVTPAAAIVARRSYQEAPTNAEFRIELQQAGEKADQTFVRLTNDEAVTSGFDFNYDLSKEFNKSKANIYTMVTTVMGDDDTSVTQTAGNCLPMTEQTTIVPLGMKIVTAGEYTIAIPSGTSGVGVTLVDNETGIRTNLALEDYTVTLEAGTQDDRFYLEISPIKYVATDIELLNGENGENGVRKVMNDGILYIIRDGRVFNAQGARVK